MTRVLSVLIVLGFLFSCTNSFQRNYIQLEGEAQGTTFFISYYDSLETDYSGEIERLLIDFDDQLSVYLPTSFISRFNNNEIDTLFLSDKTTQVFECFKKSITIQSYTNGNFNHGLQNLILANRLSSYSQGIFNKKIRDSILSITSEVVLTDTYLTKVDSLSKFSFDAIAQGLSVDVVADFLDSKGVLDYMVEIGGEVKVRGKSKSGELWKIALESPSSTVENRKVQETISLKNESVVTSGSYRKFKIIDGVRYSHAINPKTGLGVTHSLLSVSVITDNCAIADGLATAFLVMGKEETVAFLENNNQYQAKIMFIESDTLNNYTTSYYGDFEDYLID